MKSITARLSLMMFLQFFIWGAFFVTMGAYLLEVFDGEEGLNSIIGSAYATHNWAGLLAPVFVGLIADRFLMPRKLMQYLIYLEQHCFGMHQRLQNQEPSFG